MWTVKPKQHPHLIDMDLTFGGIIQGNRIWDSIPWKQFARSLIIFCVIKGKRTTTVSFLGWPWCVLAKNDQILLTKSFHGIFTSFGFICGCPGK